MQFRYQRALCLLLMLFLILSAVPGTSGLPAALAEDTADVAVHSAPLERSTAARNGMVRVRLLSIGSNPASLTVTAVGAMAVSGGPQQRDGRNPPDAGQRDGQHGAGDGAQAAADGRRIPHCTGKKTAKRLPW